MKSGEKPFNQLSQTEKEIFQLCGDIIRYKEDVTVDLRFKISQIRKRATQLFENLSAIDFEQSDRHVKVGIEYTNLKRGFEALRKEIYESLNREYKDHDFNFQNPTDRYLGDIDVIMETLRSKIKPLTTLRLSRERYQEIYGQGDYISFSMKINGEDKNLCNGMTIFESFEAGTIEWPPYLMKECTDPIEKKLNIQFPKAFLHKHETGTREISFYLDNITTETALKIIRMTLEHVKANPRKRRDGEPIEWGFR